MFEAIVQFCHRGRLETYTIEMEGEMNRRIR